MNIRIEDLLPDCGNCGGSRQIENPELKRDQGGFGRRLISPTTIECNECNGKGVIMTESGKALLKFFRLPEKRIFFID